MDWFMNFPYNVRNKKLRNACFVAMGILTFIIFIWIIIEGIQQI